MPLRRKLPSPPATVAAVFDRYEPEVREKLLALRAMIFEVAETEDAGDLEETLKWGQPAYLSKSGTTVRIDKEGHEIALYVNCRTTLVDEWRERFPGLNFCGTRSLTLGPVADPADVRFRMCIADALTYRRCKRERR